VLTEIQKLKVRLLAEGMTISETARRRLTEMADGRPLTLADYATTSGIPLRLPGEIWVNAPFHKNDSRAQVSPSRWVLDVSKDCFIVRLGALAYPADPTPVPAYAGKCSSTGEPYSHYGLTHTDRVRVSPVSGCSCSCAFCDLPRTHSYSLRPAALLIETINCALNDPVLSARHVLVSGGTPQGEDFGDLLKTYVEVLGAFPSVPVDIMMLAIPEVVDLDLLHARGANEVVINIELFDSEARHRLMPQKNRVSKEQCLKFIERAVATFGAKVRSLLIVGLEPMEETLRGVEALAERGCEPVLSPFRPHPSTPMAAHPPASYDFMCELYERAVDVAARHGAKLGPKCVACQHNTLTFADGSDYYQLNRAQ
jgi:hypothetical protein